MQDALKILDKTFSPPLFCAPIAGGTHSAFRRLLADFGGYGTLYTELLSGKHILHEDASVSTYLKRRPCEGNVIYQLLLTDTDHIPDILTRILPLEPAGIDVNCGCAGRDVRRAGGGVRLFENKDKLKSVLSALRKAYQGPVLVKCRLDRDTPDWQAEFIKRLRIMEDCGVNALTVHPRSANQHRKRAARHDLFKWIADNTRIPIIANGDILGPHTLAKKPDHFGCTSGIMIGRMALVQPWIFAAWNKPDYKPDFTDTWQHFFKYMQEDFEPNKQLIPLKLFSKYFAQNFIYSHFFYTALRNAESPEALNRLAIEFLATSPAICSTPSTGGI